MAATSPSPWLVVPDSRPAARLRLICFPYAGAGASAFWAWSRALPWYVEVCAVQLPGREERLGEPMITNWREATDRIAAGLTSVLDRPFALAGHSMGAILAFELARRLRRDGQQEPVCLFVGGRGAPHLPPDPPTYDLPLHEFTQTLRQFAGTPDEVLEDPDVMDVFLPLLRADFCLSETYEYQPDAPLATPICAYGGVQDEHVPPGDLEGWREHTTGRFRRVMFPGGHFFLNENRAALLFDLTRELERAPLSPAVTRKSA